MSVEVDNGTTWALTLVFTASRSRCSIGSDAGLVRRFVAA